MPDSSKTEQATPRRRQKAREQGQLARSRDLISSVGAGAGVMLLAAEAPTFAAAWRSLLSRTLDAAVSGQPDPAAWFGSSVFTALRLTSVVMGLSWMAALLAAVAQGGLVFAPTALAPNPSRMSPASRLQQLFSLTALSRLLKSLLPGSAVVYLAGAILAREWGALAQVSHAGAARLAAYSLGLAFELAWKAALVMLVWSGADYLIERRKLEGDLRMSRQDLKDEYKETEGHPTVKARIRRLRRQARRRRMIEDVKRASVVITNPDEFAVALEYRPEMPAPTVVAKGRNLLAQQIKQAARWHGIPLVENRPLAHALYRAVEVGQSIPPKLYAVVAAILAAIYRAQERASRTAPSGRAER